jgi:hypothetical protein
VTLKVVAEEAATACPRAEALSSAVAVRLGRNPFTPNGSASVDVAFAREKSRFRAEIRTRDEPGHAPGTRVLYSSPDGSCDTLGQAVALALALYVDPKRALGTHVSTPEVPASEAPKPEVPKCPEPAPVAPPPRPFVTALGAGVLVANELLPGVNAGYFARFRVELPSSRLSFEAGMTHVPETRTADGRFAFGMTFAQIGACVDAWQRAGVALGACAHGAGGELHAVVYQLLPTVPGGRTWIAADVAIRGRFSLFGPLEGTLELGAYVPALRHDFRVLGEPNGVFQQPLFVPTAKGFVGLHFP